MRSLGANDVNSSPNCAFLLERAFHCVGDPVECVRAHGRADVSGPDRAANASVQVGAAVGADLAKKSGDDGVCHQGVDFPGRCGELVATHAADEIRVSERVGHGLRGKAQGAIAGCVAHGVVDGLEADQVDREHGNGRGTTFLAQVCALGRGDLTADELEERAAAHEASEVVFVRDRLQTLDPRFLSCDDRERLFQALRRLTPSESC